MKRTTILLSIVLACAMMACTKTWENHYAELEESPLTLYEYFSTEAEYSDFFNLLKTAEVDSELVRDQYLTVWAVKNQDFDISSIGVMEPGMVGKYHANFLSLGASSLKNGLRVRTLNGIYLTIKQNGGENFANDVKIISSQKFKNGVVHQIESILIPRVNMFDYVCMLPDEYSIIRDSIVFYNQQMFDKTNSIPIGVDQTGNTIYDSIFYVYNPIFEKANISSEFSEFTLFIPKNEVINNTLTKLKSQYEMMGKKFASADSLLAMTWIKEAIFHPGKISDYLGITDLTSSFNRTWRTTVQKVDQSNPIEFSNGIAYNVSDLKIPNNVVIKRIKSLSHYYEYLDETEKAELYHTYGAKSTSIVNAGAAALSGRYYWCYQALGDSTNDEFSIEFAPLGLDTLEDKSIDAYEMKVPPGEYNFYMGFWSKGHPYVDFYFQSGSDPIAADLSPLITEVNVSASTPWNFDRVNETDPLIKKWDGLGGLVGVVTITGDEMTTFRVKVKFNKLLTSDASKKMTIYHWSLKPTANNY